MTDYVLAGLTKRRAELTGEADALQARLAQIGTDLSHLDAVIRQFDPDYDLSSIRPKRSRGPDVARPGEMSRFVLGVLREAAEPMRTPDLAILRTTPALLGLFSLITIWADRLVHTPTGIVAPRTAAWYAKCEPTFSDAQGHSVLT